MPLKLNSTGGGSVTLDAPSTAGTYTVTVPATNQTLGLTSGTAVASTSGTSIDFTGIPSWVKRITVIYNGISTSGTADYLVQLGTAGGVVSSGYISGALRNAGSVTSSAGILLTGGAFLSTSAFSGTMTICNSGGTNTWAGSGVSATLTASGSNFAYPTAGGVTLSGALTSIRITTTNGTDTFDAGSINIMYEG